MKRNFSGLLFCLVLFWFFPLGLFSLEITGTEASPVESSENSKKSTLNLQYLWDKLKNKVSNLRDSLKEAEEKLKNSEEALKESQTHLQELAEQLEQALKTLTTLNASLKKSEADLKKSEYLTEALNEEIKALKAQTAWWSVGAGAVGILAGIVIQ